MAALERQLDSTKKEISDMKASEESKVKEHQSAKAGLERQFRITLHETFWIWDNECGIESHEG